MLLFFPSVRVVGFSFSLSSSFESYSFLFSSALIRSLERRSPFGVQSASCSVFLETSSSFLSSQLIVSCENILVCFGVVTFHLVGEQFSHWPALHEGHVTIDRLLQILSVHLQLHFQCGGVQVIGVFSHRLQISSSFPALQIWALCCSALALFICFASVSTSLMSRISWGGWVCRCCTRLDSNRSRRVSS